MDSVYSNHQFSQQKLKEESPELPPPPRLYGEEDQQTKRKDSLTLLTKRMLRLNSDTTENLLTSKGVQLPTSNPPSGKFCRASIQYIESQKTILSPDKLKLSNTLDGSPRRTNPKIRAYGDLIRGVGRMQKHEVQQIESLEQLGKTFQHASPKKSKVHPIQQNTKKQTVFELLFQKRIQERFLHLAERGSQADIKQMAQILQQDPKRYFLKILIQFIKKRYTVSPQDPLHLINTVNQYGQNAIYLACKNGNIEVVKFLLHNDVDLHKASKVYGQINEGPLDVCARWGHLECVQLLLQNGTFNQQELRSALNHAPNAQIKDLIRSRLSTKWLCCF